MSNKKTLEQMSTTEAKRAGITSLADRPNDKSRYGDGGLSAEMLKARFDALPNLVREKFNKIAEMLAGTDAAKYITLGGEDNALGETLFDFLALFGPRGDGITDKNISDLIETLYQEEGDEGASSRTLKDIVASICARLVDLRNFAGRAVGDFSLWVDEEGRMIVDAIDLTGDAFKLNAIDPIGKAGIRDGAVGFEKLDSELGGRIKHIENLAFEAVSYNAATGVLVFKSKNGGEKSVDLPLELLVKSGYFDESERDVVLVLANGGEIRIPFDAYVDKVSEFITELRGSYKDARLEDGHLVFEAHDGSSKEIDLSSFAIRDEVNTALGSLTARDAELEKTDANFERRISNIEQHISDDYFVTDDSVAYSKAVPARACTYAKLASFGGMTHTCNNRIKFPYVQASNSIFTASNDGTIAINGSGNLSYSLRIKDLELKAGTTYTLSGIDSGGGYQSYYLYVNEPDGTNRFDLGNGITFTANSDGLASVTLVINSTTSISTVVKPMLNEGSTALPFESWYEGVRNSKVTEIKNHGANILPYPYFQINITHRGITFTDNGDGSITLNGKSDGNAVCYLHTNADLGSLVAGKTYIPSISNPNVNNNVILMCNYVDAVEGVQKNFTTSQKGAWVYPSTAMEDVIYLLVLPDTVLDNVTVYPMINEGSTVAPYKPNREPISYPIPAEIQAINGYGKDGFVIDLEKQTSAYEGEESPLPVRLKPIIEVEGGGSLEFVNEYKNAVPSTVKYLLKEESSV